MPTTESAPAREATSDAADEQLASALRISVMRLARRMRAEKSDESLTLTQLSALAVIAKHGPLSPTALAELERVQPPSMTRVIAILEERGLAIRIPHPSDRRQSVIEISPAGRALIDEDRRRRTVWLARVLDDLEAEDRAALKIAVPILERLAQA
ncbi:MAG: MarR family transcriptional regulator [Acidimicrobiaceae bacterium]|jgi:DNA-binding MarR family transcriptional regulator|nr:MarR family transcriptional regulator [Acidimicrobiaceae bacterium]